MANGIRNAASIIQKMQYSPIKQKELAGAIAQEGYDNKAVSQADRMLGRQVAGERARLMELDKFGSDLAMRKDKLEFAKKVDAQKQSMAQEALEMQESNIKQDMIFKGIEFGVNVAGTGIGYYRNQRAREYRQIEMKAHKAMIDMYTNYSGIKISNNNYASDQSSWETEGEEY